MDAGRVAMRFSTVLEIPDEEIEVVMVRAQGAKTSTRSPPPYNSASTFGAHHCPMISKNASYVYTTIVSPPKASSYSRCSNSARKKGIG
jgi:hypothetical protein